MKNNPISILLIEDNPGDAHLIREILEYIEEQSFKIERVDRLKKALEKLKEKDFNIILLDLNLPDSTGLNTLKKVYVKAFRTPIVVLTGLDDNQMALEAIKNGAQDYLPKDKLNEDILFRVIRYAIERNRIKLESEENEKKYSNLFNNSLNAFALHQIVTNKKGKPIDYIFLDVNKAFEKILGITAQDVIGRRVTELIPGIEQEPFIDLYGKVALTGEPIHFEQYSKALNRHFEIAAFSPQKGQFAAIFMDITQRKKAIESLKENENKLRSLTENAADFIFIKDKNRKFTFANKAMLNLLGLPENEVTGKKPEEIFGAEQALIIKEVDNRTFSGETVNETRSLNIGEKQFFFNTTQTPLTIEDGEVTSIMGIVRDVTDQKRAEKALQDQEQKLRTIVEHGNELFYIHNTEHVLTFVSPQCKEILGYTPDEMMVNWNTLATDNPINEEGFRITEKGIKTGRRQPPYLLEVMRKDGEYRIVEIDESPIKDKNGEVIGISGALRDVTEQKRSEEALLKSEERYRLLFESNPHPMWVYDLETLALLAVNNAAVRHYGYTKDEFLSMTIKDFRPPEDVPALQNNISKAKEGIEESGEWRHQKKDGTIIYVQITSHTLLWAGRRSKVVLVHDITDRKLSEEALKASEEKFRSLAENSPSAIFIHQMGRIVYANQKSIEALGYNADELYSHDFDFLNLIAPEYHDVVKSSFKQHLEGKEVDPYEYAILTRNGARIEAINSTKLIEYKGQPAILAVTTDITERKQAERKLQESENRFRTAFEKGPMGIAIIGPDLKYISTNETFCQIFGYSKEELKKMTFLDVTYAADTERDRKAAESLFKGEMDSLKTEKRYVKKNKQIIWANINVSVIKDANGQAKYAITIIEDITERKKAEEDLKLFRTLIDKSNDSVMIIDPVTDRFLDVNERACVNLGYSRKELLTKTFFDIDPTLTKASIEKKKAEIQSGDSIAIEGLHKRKDGSTFPVEVNVTNVLLNRVYIVTIARDISDRKKQQKALEESEELLSHARDAAGLGLYDWNLRDDMKSKCSESYLKISGLNPDHKWQSFEELLARIHPDDRQSVQDEVSITLDSEGTFDKEYRIILPDGSIRWLSDKAKIIRDSQGKAIRVIGAIADISERKEAEQKLLLQNTALRSAANGIVITDKDGMIVWVNEAFTELTGYSFEEAVAQNPRILKSGKQDEKFYKSMWETISSGHVWHGELVNIKKDGKEYIEELTITPVRTEKGNITHFIGIKTDITTRKQAEEEIRWLARLPQENPTPVLRVSTNGVVLYANKASAPLLEEWQCAVNEALPEAWREFVSEVFESAEVKTAEITVADNLLSLTFAPVSEEEYINIYGIDITELKKTEALLRKRTHDLGERVKEMTCLYGVNHLLDNSNLTVDQKFQKIVDIIPPGWQYPKDTCARITYHGKEYKTDNFLKTKWQQVQEIIINGENQGTLEIGYLEEKPEKDIGPFLREEDDLIKTIAKNIEEYIEYELAINELKNSEERLKILFEYAPDAIYLTNLKGIFIDANMAAEALIGYGKDELVGKSLFDFNLLTASQTPRAAKLLAKNVMGKPTGPDEFVLKRKDKKKVVVEIRTFPVITQNKNLIIGICRHITDRRKAEQAIRESEEKYRAIFEESKDTIYVSTVDGKFIDINPAGVQLFGYESLDELMSVNIQEAIYTNPTDRKNFQEALNRQGAVVDYEMNLKKKDGQNLIVLVTATVITDDKGNVTGYRGIIRDITSQKQLERQLLQAQKMEAIGTLAGGIAHDFNNILSAILGYTELTRDIIADNSIVSKNLDQVYKAGLRAKDLIQQILTFSRQTDHKPQPLQIGLVFKEALKLMRASLPATIEIRQNFISNGAFVLADPTQIHQVIMNLCTNAYDAMRKGGGLLEVNLNSIHINGDKIIDNPDLPMGNYVKISISDTGVGMDQQTAKRIFDPFFTTKDAGAGTGLGLSVVHGIVKRHGGDITVQSEPGKGTTFKVYLPQFKAKGEMTVEEQPEPLKGKGNILLVDDEKSIVDSGMRILQKLGYRVTGKTQSLEALETFKQSPEQFDLIITDLTMPNMTGLVLAQNILGIRPDIPVILITGFNENVTKDMAKQMGISDLIMKPVITSDLSKVIRAALDKKTVGC